MNCSLVVNAFQCLDQITWGQLFLASVIFGAIAFLILWAYLDIKYG